MPRIELLLVLLCTVQIFAETPALEGITESNARFSRDFMKVLDIQGNMVSSPLSAHLALSMTQLGAGGSTASQMSRALHLPADLTLAKTGFKQLSDQLQSENSEGINIKIANRMYVKSGFDIKQEFVNSVRDTFNSEPQSVDFVNPGTRNVINQWVEQQTNDKIKDLIQYGVLNSDTRLVLVNALYFNGKWANVFKENSFRIFYVSPTHQIMLPMMILSQQLNFGQFEDMKLVELPYEGNRMSLVILLPQQRTGVSDLENKMQTTDLSSLIKSSTKTAITLAMPKFKIETTIDLKEPLTKMGMGEIFESPDFTGITTEEKLRVSQVLQKTIIEVAENGTEAAAATFVAVEGRSGKGLNEIRIDHPFLFYLVHRTTQNNHVVLFSGRFVTP